MPLIPPSAQLAQHNSNPSTKNKHKAEPARGRLHDLQREWAPPTQSAPVSENASRWRAFANSTVYPDTVAEGGEHVTEEWLIRNGPDYSRPWLASLENGDAENDGPRLFKYQGQRQKWWQRLQRTILRSPRIPLVIRTIVWVFSFVALVLGGKIYSGRNKCNGADKPRINGSSPRMAVIVDAVALIYTLYITYDEYRGKPLGLRSARAKMRLILLDLFFIVFDSANLSLAFQAVSDFQVVPGSVPQCSSESLGHRLGHQQKALASVLLIALVSWIMTFAISVFR